MADDKAGAGFTRRPSALPLELRCHAIEFPESA